MKASVRKVALLAVSAVLVACSVDTGTVIVGVGCDGEGCGQSGDLRARVEDCDEDTAFYGDRSVNVPALTTASAFAFSFENVEAGLRCVQVFLDVDTSGNLSAGDVVSSLAVHQGVGEIRDDEDQELDDDPEVDVDVETDEISAVGVTLDQVLPAQF